MMRMRTPNRNELTILSASALTVAAAVFAVHFWMRRGVCIDSVVCATVSILTIAGILLLMRRRSAVARTKALSDRPVLLVMTSGPRKEKTAKRIEGKMPEELDH